MANGAFGLRRMRSVSPLGSISWSLGAMVLSSGEAPAVGELLDEEMKEEAKNGEEMSERKKGKRERME